MNLLEPEEREKIRRVAVSAWIGARADLNEIGRRLGVSAEAVITRYWVEIAIGKKQWQDPAAFVQLFEHARGGDGDAMITCLAISDFDHPAIAQLLRS